MKTKFQDFIKESFFHTEKDLNDILDRISKVGYNNISDSDKLILKNYSKNDEDIREIIIEMKKLTAKFKELNNKIDDALKNNKDDELKELKSTWLNYHREMSKYEHLLRYVYNIEDPIKIWQYEYKYL